MIGHIVTFALHQRVFVLILSGALAVFGWLALRELPIEAFPDVQDVQVQVVTQFPGQAPEEVERAFNRAFTLLNRRITLFLSLPLATLSQLALKRELDAIGRSDDEP